MKKSYLVYFSIGTRVIADENASDEEIEKIARNKILSAPEQYVCLDNLEDIMEDVEVPYNPEYDNQQ